MRAALASGLVAILTACGATAGVPSVTVEVGGAEVTCRAETGNLDPAACAEWATFIIRANPEAARVEFSRSRDGQRCEVALFDADGHIIGREQTLPCRPLNPNGSGEVFEIGE
jgi:hypothetical protein